MLEAGTFSNFKSEKSLVKILSEIDNKKVTRNVVKFLERQIRYTNGLKFLNKDTSYPNSFQMFKKLYKDNIEDEINIMIKEIQIHSNTLKLPIIISLCRNIALTKLKLIKKEI